ncbi:MAG: NAD(P)H-hydrate dehydratase [Solirubrobacterales bacterium]
MRPWLVPLYDSAGMAAADRWAIDEAGIPSLDLMETAGRAVADAAVGMVGGECVLVVCGKGNNAGDGLVAARHLAELGLEVEVQLLWPGEELSPDATANLDRLQGIPVDEGPGSLVRREPPGLVVDAILGTGFEGEPREPVAAAIEWINRAACPVLACDIPSGVDASTGAAGLAVQADRTVTFHGPKVGQFIRPGKGLTGALEVVPIGFPADAPPGEAAGVIAERVLTLLPPRGPESTKFSSGRVSLVGGSRGLTGAVVLASRGAIRAGAGYATAAVPDSLEPVVTAAQAEVMTLACPEGDRAGVLGPEAADTILDHCQGAAAVVLGSGMGRADGTAGLVRQLVETIEAPLVVDADALSLLGDDPGPIASRGYPTIITPHPGEMARLLGREPAAVEAQRLGSALEEAARTGAVVVLKGDDSIVAGSDGVAIDDIESPGLATAGTGDVLAGVCCAFLARGLDPFDAAAAAVFAHARAGRIASGRVGSADGTIASDVVEALPEAIGPLP